MKCPLSEIRKSFTVYLIPDVSRQFYGFIFKGRKVFEDEKITMSLNVGNQIPTHSHAVPNNGYLNFTFDSNTAALTFAVRSLRSRRLGLLQHPFGQ